MVDLESIKNPVNVGLEKQKHLGSIKNLEKVDAEGVRVKKKENVGRTLLPAERLIKALQETKDKFMLIGSCAA